MRRDETARLLDCCPDADFAYVALNNSYRGRAQLCNEARSHPSSAQLTPASQKLLDRLGWKQDTLDIIELNEAFASQGLATLRQLGLADDDPRANINGRRLPLAIRLGCRVPASPERQHSSYPSPARREPWRPCVSMLDRVLRSCWKKPEVEEGDFSSFYDGR